MHPVLPAGCRREEEGHSSSAGCALAAETPLHSSAAATSASRSLNSADRLQSGMERVP